MLADGFDEADDSPLYKIIAAKIYMDVFNEAII